MKRGRLGEPGGSLEKEEEMGLGGEEHKLEEAERGLLWGLGVNGGGQGGPMQLPDTIPQARVHFTSMFTSKGDTAGWHPYLENPESAMSQRLWH